jgi:hypothetical protein
MSLPRVKEIIVKRFQNLAPGLFNLSVEKLKSARSPSFASPEYSQCSPNAFASNLTATWGEFYNDAHIDNDVGAISYGGWCGIKEESGFPASKVDGFDVAFGQFFLPGISTLVDFDSVDGWTDLFWASNLLFHQTVQSQRPSNSPFTRFGFSVQINKCFYDGCITALGDNSLKFAGFNARDAYARKLIYPSSKLISVLYTLFQSHSNPPYLLLNVQCMYA